MNAVTGHAGEIVRPMRVHFHGRLRRKYGPHIDLGVDNPASAFRALIVLKRGFRDEISRGSYRVVRGDPRRGMHLDPVTLSLPIGPTREMHIFPVAAGRKTGGIGKDILGALIIVAAVAAMVFAPEIAAALPAALGATAAGVVSVATSVAIMGASLLMEGISRAIAPQPGLGASYLFNGQLNTSQQGIPVPVVYGQRVRVGSVVVASSYSAEDYTTYTSDYQGQGYYINNGGASGYSGALKAFDSGNPLPPGATGKGGGKGSSSGGYEAPNTLESKAIIRIVDLISEGPIGGFYAGPQSIFFNGTPLQAADGTWNFRGVQWTLLTGNADQAPVPGFEYSAENVAVGQPVLSGSGGPTPMVQTAVSSTASRIRVTVTLPALYATNTQNGDINPSSLRLQIYCTPNGGTKTLMVDDTINGKCDGPYQKSYVFGLPGALSGATPTTSWAIEIDKITQDSAVATTANSLVWSSYDLITDTQMIYPYSAYVALAIDSEAFGSNIPSRTYEIAGMQVKVPANYTPASQNSSGTWTGGSYATTGTGTSGGSWDLMTYNTVVTANPVWCLLDFLQSPRYGMGLTGAQLQNMLPQLYVISQYTDSGANNYGMVNDGYGTSLEPRYTLNGVFSQQASAFQILQALASTFRGMVYWAGGSVGISCDMPGSPVKLYTNANVIGGQFQYEGTSLKTRHTTCAVQFYDPVQEFSPSVELVEFNNPAYSGTVAQRGIKQASLVAFGCTSRGLAHRLGKWLLFTENLQTETVAFSVGLDSIDVMPGDIIQISDQWYGGTRQGGRLRAAVSTPSVLGLDAVFNPVSGVDYDIFVVYPDNSVDSRPVNSFATVTPTSAPYAWGEDYLGGNTALAVGWSFGRGSQATYTNSAGQVAYAPANTPRFDYSTSSVGTEMGLLLEQAATNQAPSSTTMGAPWGGVTVTNNAVASPEAVSTTTGATIACATTGPGGAQSSAYLNPAAGTYTMSMWLYAAAAGVYDLYACYNDSTGAQHASASFGVALTTGWQRFVLPPLAVPAGATAVYWQINLAAGQTAYAWGTQIEAGVQATSYIPTGGAAASRAADSLSMPQSVFAGQIGALMAGTLLVETQICPGDQSSGSPFSFTVTSPGSDSIVLFSNDGGQYAVTINSGGTSPSLASSPGHINIPGRAAFSWNAEIMRLCVDGDIAQMIQNQALPQGLNGLTIGVTAPFWLRRFFFYPVARTLEDIATITALSFDPASEAVAGKPYSTATLGSPLSQQPVANAVYLLSSSNNTEYEATTWQVVAITEPEVGQFSITAVQWNEGKFAAVEQNITFNMQGYSTLPNQILAPLPAPSNVAFKSYVVGVGNTTVLRTTITWTGSNDPRVVAYQVEVINGSGVVVKVLTARGLSVDVDNLSPDTYGFAVRALGTAGQTSAWAYLPQATAISGTSNTTPDAPTNLAAVGGVNQVLISWTNSLQRDVDHYEVWRSTNTTAPGQTGSGASFVGTCGGSFITDTDTTLLTPQSTWYYFVRAVTTTGVDSAWVGPATATTILITNGMLEDNAVSQAINALGLSSVAVWNGSSLPSDPSQVNGSQVVLNVPDKSLYRWDAATSTWTKAVQPVDINWAGTSNTIPPYQVAPGLTGAQIAAASVMPSNFATTSNVNPVENNAWQIGGAASASGWTTADTGAAITAVAASSSGVAGTAPSAFVGESTGRDTYYGQPFLVAIEDSWTFSVAVGGSSTSSASIGFCYTDQNSANQTWVAAGTVTPNTTGWQTISGTLKIPATTGGGTAVAFAQVWLQIAGAANAVLPAVYFGPVTVRRMINSLDIGAQSITAPQIQDGTLTAQQLSSSAAILGSQLAAAAAISSAQIASVDATTITVNQITAAQIASVDPTAINGVLDAAQIPALDASKITTGTIAATQVPPLSSLTGTLGANQIAANSLTSSQIQAGSITSASLYSGTVDANKITGGQIAGETIEGANIVGGTITSQQIATAGITAENLAISSPSNVIWNSCFNQVIDGWLTYNGTIWTPIGSGPYNLGPYGGVKITGFNLPVTSGAGGGPGYVDLGVWAPNGTAPAGYDASIPCDASKSYAMQAAVMTNGNCTFNGYLIFDNAAGGNGTAWNGPAVSQQVPSGSPNPSVLTDWYAYASPPCSPEGRQVMTMLLRATIPQRTLTETIIGYTESATTPVSVSATNVITFTSATAAGDDYNTDQSMFYSTPVTGDFTATLQVNFNAPSVWKMGLMIRDSLSYEGCSQINAHVVFQNGGTMIYGWADFASGSNAAPDQQEVQAQSSATGYVRIVRSTNTVTFLWSVDGTNWTTQGGLTPASLNSTLYLGPAAYNDGTTGSGSVQNWIIDQGEAIYITRTGLGECNPNATSAPPWTPGGATMISGGQLTAGSVNTQQLAAQSVTANQIQSETITAAQIAGNTITGDKIAGNTITGTNIQGETITGNNIAAGTITASKVVISDPTNIVLNPTGAPNPNNTALADGWNGPSSLAATASGVPSGAPAQMVMGTTLRDSLYQPSNSDGTVGFMVQPGEVYFCSAWFAGASTYGSNVGLIVFNAAGNEIAVLGVPNGNIVPSGTWQYLSGQVTIPSFTGAAYARPWFQINNTAAITGTVYFTNFICRKAASSELLVDGSVTALTIAADTITSNNIKTGGITAASLAIGNPSNIIWNPEFYSDFSGWTTGSIGPSWTFGPVSGSSYAPAWNLANETSGWAASSAALASGDFIDIDWNPSGSVSPTRAVSAQAGDVWSIQAMVITENCVSQVWLQFFDASNNLLSTTPSAASADTSPANGNSLSNYQPVWISATAPANTAFVRGWMRFSFDSTAATAPTGNAFAVFTRVMLGYGNPNQTGPAPWSPGGVTSISGGMIQADTIQARAIRSGTITATQIASYTITGDQIAGNTISADKLTVGNSGNIIWNGCFSITEAGWNWNSTYSSPPSRVVSGDAMFLPGGCGMVTFTAAAGAGGDMLWWEPYGANGNFNGASLPAVLGDTIIVQGIFIAPAGVTISMRIMGSNASGGSTNDNIKMAAVAVSGATTGGVLSDWTPVSMVFTLEDPNTTCVTLGFSATNTTAAAVSNVPIYFSQFLLGKCAPGTPSPVPWSPGGVTSINGGIIDTGTVTASQIAANTITANKMAAGSITAASLAVGTGSNLIWNPSCQVSTVGWQAASGTASGMSLGMATESGYYCPSEGAGKIYCSSIPQNGYANTLWQPTFGPGNQNLYMVACSPGQWIEGQAKIGCNRCAGMVALVFYDSSGNELQVFNGTRIVQSSGSTLDSFGLSDCIAQAPSNAAYVSLIIQAFNDGGTDFVGVGASPYTAGSLTYVWFCQALLGPTAADPNGTNKPQAYVPGGVTSIQGGMIQSRTIYAEQISSGTITTNELAAGTLSANNITTGTLNSGVVMGSLANFGTIQVTNAYIANETVGSLQIAGGAIGTPQIASSAVTAWTGGSGSGTGQASVSITVTANQACQVLVVCNSDANVSSGSDVLYQNASRSGWNSPVTSGGGGESQIGCSSTYQDYLSAAGSYTYTLLTQAMINGGQDNSVTVYNSIIVVLIAK
jgi:predicted phage tail protein